MIIESKKEYKILKSASLKKYYTYINVRLKIAQERDKHVRHGSFLPSWGPKAELRVSGWHSKHIYPLSNLTGPKC